MAHRKQSYDLQTRNSRQMSSTVGSGLMNAANTSLMSPKNIVSGARNAVMNNTVTDGLAVTGGKKEGWANPDSTARNGLNMRSNDLSI